MIKITKFKIAYYIICFLTGLFFSETGYSIMNWKFWVGAALVLSLGLCVFNIGMETFRQDQKVIEILSASCISNNICGLTKEEIDKQIKSCLSHELAEKIVSYVDYESYPIISEYNDEQKHMCTVQIVKE